MSETNPGYADGQQAGDVGARRATVGTPTDPESVNVPPTRPGAAENAYEDEVRRRPEETFVPEAPEPDDRTDAVRSRAVEEESMRGGVPAQTPGSTTPYQGDGARNRTTGRARESGARGGDDEEEQLRESIKETRRELGETVSALAHKADIKSRAAEAAGSAKERAAEMAATAKAKASEMTGTARTRAHEMSGTAKVRAHEMSDTARTRAHEMSGTAKSRATEMSGTAKSKAVELKERQGGKRPLLMAAAAAGAVVVVLVRRARQHRHDASWRARFTRKDATWRPARLRQNAASWRTRWTRQDSSWRSRWMGQDAGWRARMTRRDSPWGAEWLRRNAASWRTRWTRRVR